MAINVSNVQTFKINVMPEVVYNDIASDNLINEDELYLIESPAVVPLSEGGTGIAVANVAELRTALGVASANHTSDSATCGVGNSSTYGHLKLSDATNSLLDINEATAATPVAVKAAYDLASTKADPSVSFDVTLAVGSWVSGTYTVSNEAITATCNGYISVAQSATDAEYNAAITSNIRVTSQASGTITLKCTTVPTIDIPISVLCIS